MQFTLYQERKYLKYLQSIPNLHEILQDKKSMPLFAIIEQHIADFHTLNQLLTDALNDDPLKLSSESTVNSRYRADVNVNLNLLKHVFLVFFILKSIIFNNNCLFGSSINDNIVFL